MNPNPLPYDKSENKNPSTESKIPVKIEIVDPQSLESINLKSSLPIEKKWDFQNALFQQQSEINQKIHSSSISIKLLNQALLEMLAEEDKLRAELSTLNINKGKITAFLSKSSGYYNEDLILIGILTNILNYIGTDGLDEIKMRLDKIQKEIVELKQTLDQSVTNRQNLTAIIKAEQQKIADLELCFSTQKNINERDFQAFIDALKQPELKVLSLADLQLKPQFLVTVLKTLTQYGTHITHLDLSNCRISNGTDKTAIKQIVNFLQKNKALIFLSLNKNSIDDDDFKMLGENLVNHPLKFLNVSDNLITESGIYDFSDIIKPNKHLEFIKLDNNWVHTGKSNLAEIAKRLTKNNPKRMLDLSQNFVFLTKELLSLGFFHSFISLANSCIDPEKKISRDQWIVFLMVKKTIVSDHALIIVEGMKNTGQLFLARLELFINPMTGKGGISFKYMDPKDKVDLLNKYKFVSWSVKRTIAKKLILNIRDDEGKAINYSKLGIASAENHNCFTWAAIQLKKVGIEAVDIHPLINIPKLSPR